eukprot:Tamp_20698.p4 GENE.Tamp_20698~~Tamp_20698.p4  ORF type:complete len:106 (-),score=11.45 Tamp_20698:652-969(-)
MFGDAGIFIHAVKESQEAAWSAAYVDLGLASLEAAASVIAVDLAEFDRLTAGGLAPVHGCWPVPALSRIRSYFASPRSCSLDNAGAVSFKVAFRFLSSSRAQAAR